MSKSILEQYREIQEQMNALGGQLQALEKNPELEKTKGLIEELNALVKNSGLSADAAVFAICEVFGKRKVASLIGAEAEAKPGKKGGSRMKIYTHPKTGETITAGKIYGTLKEWVDDLGVEALNPRPA